MGDDGWTIEKARQVAVEICPADESLLTWGAKALDALRWALDRLEEREERLQKLEAERGLAICLWCSAEFEKSEPQKIRDHMLWECDKFPFLKRIRELESALEDPALPAFPPPALRDRLKRGEEAEARVRELERAIATLKSDSENWCEECGQHILHEWHQDHCVEVTGDE